jgi:hypothetical protein
MQGHDACLRAGAEKDEGEHEGSKRGRYLSIADGGEFVAAARAREHAEGKQQRQRAEARHDEIDIAGPPVVRIAMVRHDERP